MASLIYNILPIPPRPIAYINPNDTVCQCIEVMTEKNIGALVVVDEDKKLIGLVSERDILQSCFYKGLNDKEATAKDVAYKNVSILTPKDTVEKAMQVITETKRRHILIQENGRLIAIVSIGDLLFYLLEDKARVIAHLEQYINS